MKLTESNAALVNISDSFVFVSKSPFRTGGPIGTTSVFVNSEDKYEKVILYSNHNNTLASVTFRKGTGIDRESIIYRSDPGLPSYARFWSTGEKRLEVFTNSRGQVSRPPNEGPAIIKYAQRGNTKINIFVENGVAVSEKDYRSCCHREVKFKFVVYYPGTQEFADSFREITPNKTG